MLPAAIFDIADRLVTTLTTIVGALVALITPQSTPDSPEYAAQTLLQRVITLMATIIRLEHGGTARKPAAPAAPSPEPIAPPDRTPSPRRPPGWLLDALPDLAPAVAADLAAILADPAFAALLEAAPTIRHALRPFLHGLDLTLPIPSTPPPDASPPDAPPPPAPNHLLQTAFPPTPPRQTLEPKLHSPNPTPSHAQFVT